MARNATALLIMVTLALAACGDETGGDNAGGGNGDDSGKTTEVDTGPFADSEIDGGCPDFLAVGVPTELRLRVKNTGSDDSL